MKIANDLTEILKEDRVPLVYAHRGASGYYVDNTIKAFDMAVEMGADGLESDVYITKDGIPFLFHDSRIKIQRGDRIEEVKPNTLYLRDLDKVVLENNERVPLVEEFFERYSGKKAKSGELLRFSFDFHPGSGSAVAKLAQKYDCEDQLYMCAGYGFLFRSVYRVSKRIHLIASNTIRPLTFLTYDSKISKYARYNIEIFNIKAADFKPEFIPKLVSKGYQYYIWDLHDEKKLRTYLPYRPFGIYSNYPDLALKIRKEIFRR